MACRRWGLRCRRRLARRWQIADATVVALTGDGGLLICLGELATAVRERLRIITIVFNDASLSLIEIKQQARQLAPQRRGARRRRVEAHRAWDSG